MMKTMMKTFLNNGMYFQAFCITTTGGGRKAYEKRLVFFQFLAKKKKQKKTKKKSELVLSQIIIRDATLGLLTCNWKEDIALWTIWLCYQIRTWKKKNFQNT